MIVVHLTDNWLGPDGKEYPVGAFLELDDQVAKEVIESGAGKKETPDEHAAEKARKADDERKRAQDEHRRGSRTSIGRIHERIGDDPAGGFKLTEFVRDVAMSCKSKGRHTSEKLQRWDAHCKTDVVEYDDSQGGYLVPAEHSNQILETRLEASIVRPRAMYVPMATNRISFPAVVDNDHSTNLFGGINIQRPGETDAKTKDKPTFRQIELTLHKLTGLVAVSDEMLEDSPISIQPLLTDVFGQAIAFVEDDDFITGTGAGQALGVMNAGCLVTQAAEVGQAAATIVYENIVRMWSRLYPRGQVNAIWLISTDVFPQLATMALPIGVGGGPAYLPANGLSGSPYGTLMGRPVIMTEKCATLGTTGDIILCDFSQYLIGGKSGGGVATAVSEHLYFNYDETALRFVLRSEEAELKLRRTTGIPGDGQPEPKCADNTDAQVQRLGADTATQNITPPRGRDRLHREKIVWTASYRWN